MASIDTVEHAAPSTKISARVVSLILICATWTGPDWTGLDWPDGERDRVVDVEILTLATN